MTFTSVSQSYKFIYHLDKNLASTSKENAEILGKAYEKDNKLILDCFLKTTGKMILSATVKDSTLSTLDGMFKTYYDDMSIESAGSYVENDMEGMWRYWDSYGYLTDSVIYHKGIRIAYASYKYNFYRPATLKQLIFGDSLKNSNYTLVYSFTDSIKDTFDEKLVLFKKGKATTNFEVHFVGQRGLLKTYDSTGAAQTDSVFDRKMKEAEYAGGDDAWKDFLRQTLNAVVPAENNAPEGKYTVIISFIVNRNGTLDDIHAENDPGYGMAEEAIRVIKKSNKWTPAILYGAYRRVYRRQPITFVIEEN